MEAENIIKVDDLVRAYSRLGVDVRKYFDDETIELKFQNEGGFGAFSNCLPGDAQFYSALMKKIGYDASDKWEFRTAGEYVRSSDRVLDIGCGIGHFSQFCRHYKGIDLNKSAVDHAQALGRNVLLEPLEMQPLGDFDVVALFQVLEHVSDPLEFVRAAYATLRAGGLLIIAVPNADGVLGKSMNVTLNYPPHHLTWWSESALRDVARVVGLEPVALRREPLQRVHFSDGLFAWFCPRTQSHFDFSIRTRVIRRLFTFLVRLTPHGISEVSFITGHTIMMVARKFT